MTTPISRRQCLASASLAIALPVGGQVLGSQPADASAGTPAKADPFPSQDPALVREMVSVSHGNLERVTALLKDAPRLANATYDWGFGDWETALGAASHTGRRQIAALLIEYGARPDIFCLAMLGHLDAVKAMVAAQPGIQRTRGPHGLTLMHHAKAGGEGSSAVVAYLATLPDADAPYQDLPLTDAQRDLYVGEYSFGSRDDQRFKIFTPENSTGLSIQRTGGVPRRLFHQGSHTFHPAGAPEVLIAFSVEGGRTTDVSITSPAPLATARRL